MTSDPSRLILARNLNKLIDAATPPGDKRSVRAWAMSKGLDVRMIDRLAKGQHAVTLDKLEQIAEACGLKPWHLLYEDLDPHALPDAPISAEDRALLHKLRKLLNSR
jgi:transcriptional regulator with XRE-family HTH domain